MGLINFFSGQNRLLIWWYEPFIYHARLRYSPAVLWGSLLGLMIVPSMILVVLSDAVVQGGDPFKALIGGVVFGLILWTVFFRRFDMKRGQIYVRENQIERWTTGHSGLYITTEKETWPFGAIDECRIIPGDSIGQSFSLMQITAGSDVDLVGISKRIDLKAMVEHLDRGGVPVSLGNTVPRLKDQSEMTPILWLGVILLLLFLPIGVLAWSQAENNKNQQAAGKDANDPAQKRQREKLEELHKQSQFSLGLEKKAHDEARELREQNKRDIKAALEGLPGPKPATSSKPIVFNGEEELPEDLAPLFAERPSARGNERLGDPMGREGSRFGPLSADRMPPIIGPIRGNEKIEKETPAHVNPVRAEPSRAYRTWSDASGTFQIEAKMIGVTDGRVSLERRDNGRVVNVPLDRLSEADQEYVRAETAESAPIQAADPFIQNAKHDTEIVGGKGGSPFRKESTKPLLGIEYRLGGWGGEKTVGPLKPIFDRTAPARSNAVIARDGYAVGGFKVDAKQYVNAIQIIFMRLKPDGRLDPSDSYTSEWVGYKTGRSTKTLGGAGNPVVGIHGRCGAILDAVGLIIKGSE